MLTKDILCIKIRINYKIILFHPDREKNYQRVNSRVLSMIDNGAINEIKNLLELNYNKDLPIMKAHGVPEISSYLEKKISLDQCIEKIQLVKLQLQIFQLQKLKNKMKKRFEKFQLEQFQFQKLKLQKL